MSLSQKATAASRYRSHSIELLGTSTKILEDRAALIATNPTRTCSVFRQNLVDQAAMRT